ncbi:MAG: diguanylate cyclase [Rickettsiales bacterium]|nr:diguanylate cyclase [Rickettsiales bacterium]
MSDGAASQSSASEAYFVVCQNNEKESLKIVEASDGIAELLGRTRSEMEGNPLTNVLARHVCEAIDDLLEFDDFGTELDDVLKRVPHFKLTHYDGREIPFAMQIVRDQARDQHSWFRMHLKDERRQIEDDSMVKLIARNMEGVISIDESTGLPDRMAAEQSIRLLRNYVQSHELDVCVSVLRMDRYEKTIAKYGKVPCLELIKHLASCCKAKFRANDMVCFLSDTMVALILIDIPHETAPVVLNRLRWHIAKHRINFGGKADFSVTASIAYASLQPNESHDALALCVDELEKLDPESRNEIFDLTA